MGVSIVVLFSISFLWRVSIWQVLFARVCTRKRMARVFPHGKEIFFRQGQGNLSKLARTCEQHAKKRMTRANLVPRVLSPLTATPPRSASWCRVEYPGYEVGQEHGIVFTKSHTQINNRFVTSTDVTKLPRLR